VTTVACSKIEMACDCQLTYGKSLKMKGTGKVIHVPTKAANEIFGVKKALMGFCGDAGQWAEVVSWLHELDGKPPKIVDMEFLLLTDEKKIYHATSMKNWLEVADPFFAIGNGMGYAIAAMQAGKSPLEACKIAHKYDPFTGPPFKNYKL
jgi:ATP-dependent protease HslVU (ClpYQ) peptidase subunit